MLLFKFNKTAIEPYPTTLAIEEFRVLWERDKSKDKGIALKELAFVYFTADYKSTYLSFPAEERDQAIKEDIFKGQYVPDQAVLNAVDKYNQLQKTPSMRLIKAAQNTLEELIKYFNSVNFTERDKRGQPVYKVTDVTKAMGDTAKVAESLAKLDEKIRKELQENTRARGGEESGAFEDIDPT